MNGFSARSFTHPIEALAVAREDPPDLLRRGNIYPFSRAPASKSMAAACPEKSRTPQPGCRFLMRIARSIPERPGMATSVNIKPVHPSEILSEVEKLRDRVQSPFRGDDKAELRLVRSRRSSCLRAFSEKTGLGFTW